MKSAGSFKTTVFWALAAVNALLLVGLLAPLVNQSNAFGAARGRRPNLLLIPGQVIGENSAVVYVIDTSNQQIGAVSLANTGKSLVGMAPVKLNRVFEDAPAAPANEGPGPRRGGTR